MNESTKGVPSVRRMESYPWSIIHGPVEPPRLDPTFTFLGKPNDTTPVGQVVYFMYSAGRVKIGYSVGLLTRQKTLKIASAFPPVLLMVVTGTLDKEKQFHRMFAADRLHGEWFALSWKLREFFGEYLCPVGAASLKAADDEFHAHCQSMLGGALKST